MQVWYKDMSYGAGIKDEAGSPAFKHSFGYSHPVSHLLFLFELVPAILCSV
jgi:hypothetical protein